MRSYIAVYHHPNHSHCLHFSLKNSFLSTQISFSFLGPPFDFIPFTRFIGIYAGRKAFKGVFYLFILVLMLFFSFVVSHGFSTFFSVIFVPCFFLRRYYYYSC
ncbi:hypothetical protein DFH28DRAFT_944752 [Melampsora americana]|nr:hypothetical protein DFH28DRAFT_944752 [Melampsora americana]